MRKLSKWLVTKLSSVLEADLRESVVGDLTELRVSCTRAICELLGLIVRQEAQLWKTWRQWLALIGIVGAIGWLLSKVCIGIVSDVEMQALIYWQNGVRYSNGLTGVQEIEITVCTSVAVACWSWLAGFTLAVLSGKTALINPTLFCLAWFCFCGPLGVLVVSAHVAFNALGLVGVPHALGYSALALSATINLSLATLLFLIPSLLGMHRGRRKPKIARSYVLLLSATVAALTALVTWMQGWQQIALEKWSEGKWNPGGPSWQERLVPLLIMSWPVVYLLATQRHHDKKKPIIG